MTAPFDFEHLDLARLRARRGEKWQLYGPDVLPAWVAEMDFDLPPPVRRVVEEALAVDDLGYPLERPEALREAFAARMAARSGWAIDPARRGASVVQGIYVAIDRLTAASDGIVADACLSSVPECGARTRPAPGRELLVAGGERNEMDLEAFASVRHACCCSATRRTRPAVSSSGELEALAELARARLIVVSTRSTPICVWRSASRSVRLVGPEIAARTVALLGEQGVQPAGPALRRAHFGSAEPQRRFLAMPRALRGGLGSLGQAATLAAWRDGDAWLAALLAHLDANRRHVAAFVAERWPEVRHRTPEATFLAWLDFRALDLAPSPQRFFLERARVAVSDGAAFGPPGRGFARLNFGTSSALLLEILERLDRALRER
jgi:cystathionine beta-lyase